MLWTFVLASAAILGVGAFVLSSVLSDNFRQQVLADSAREVALYSDSVLSPTLVRGKRVVSNRRARRRLARTVASADELVRLTVWSRKGRHVLSSPAGRRAVRSPDVMATMRSGQAHAAVRELAVRRGGKQRSERAVVVWAPLRNAKGRPVGVAQVFLEPTALDSGTASATRTVWVVVGVVFAILWLAGPARPGRCRAARAPERRPHGPFA